MITLITGKPGAGKSLLAVEMILENSKADSIRPCFSNIEGLDYKALHCFKLEEPDRWFELPAGSLIIIDEVQDWMPPRPSGKAVPEHIDLLNKHRHQGYDIVLLTPDPMLLDVVTRKAAGRHLHCYRPFGMKSRRVFEWNSCNDSPEPSKNESNALVKNKPFDSSLFKYYKSAEVHTHKAKLPWKKFFLLIGSALVAVSLFSYTAMSLLGKGEQEKAVSELKEPALADNPERATPFIPNFNTESAETIGPASAFYRGAVSSSSGNSYLIELPTGDYAYLSDFDAYELTGITVLLYLDADAKPSYSVNSSSLAAKLKGVG